MKRQDVDQRTLADKNGYGEIIFLYISVYLTVISNSTFILIQYFP